MVSASVSLSWLKAFDSVSKKGIYSPQIDFVVGTQCVKDTITLLFPLFSVHQCVCVGIDFIALNVISGDDASTRCFVIAIIDDNIFEPTESFNVSATVLEIPSITASTVVNIVDDEGMFKST